MQQQPPRPQAHPPAGAQPQPGREEVLYEGTAKHSASLGGYLKWLLACAAGGAGAYGLYQVQFFAELPVPWWVLGFVGVPGMIFVFLRHISTRYKVTLRRVEYERGIISKNVDSLELWRVLDVRFNQSLFDRIFGIAKITLIGTDQSDPELLLHGLPNGRQLFERLRDAVQAARHTSRPMELVGQDGGFMENVGY